MLTQDNITKMHNNFTGSTAKTLMILLLFLLLMRMPA